jgi:hypothetical protein
MKCVGGSVRTMVMAGWTGHPRERDMSNEVMRVQRGVGTAYLLWLLGFVGLAGIHRFYVGRPISGIIWLLTGGLFFVGQIVDLVMMPRMVDDHNNGSKVW